MIIEGTLDECIQKFMAMPAGQLHLYEIHTAAQSDLVSAILSAAHIDELAWLRDFLYPGQISEHWRVRAKVKQIRWHYEPDTFHTIASASRFKK